MNDKKNKQIKQTDEKEFKSSYTFKPEINKESAYLSLRVNVILTALDNMYQLHPG
jgi:hypothetical protein